MNHGLLTVRTWVNSYIELVLVWAAYLLFMRKLISVSWRKLSCLKWLRKFLRIYWEVNSIVFMLLFQLSSFKNLLLTMLIKLFLIVPMYLLTSCFLILHALKISGGLLLRRLIKNIRWLSARKILLLAIFLVVLWIPLEFNVITKLKLLTGGKHFSLGKTQYQDKCCCNSDLKLEIMISKVFPQVWLESNKFLNLSQVLIILRNWHIYWN